MTFEEKVESLIKNNLCLTEGTARAYVEAEGKCVYCGHYLLDTLCDYYSSDIDHLLPKKIYKELEADPDNLVLSCRACNSIKGSMDIPNLPWEPHEAIKFHKNEVINVVKNLINEKRELKLKELNSFKSFLED